MEYEIIATNFGPIIKYDDKYLTMQDTRDLLMVQEENNGFIDAMKIHITETYNAAHTEVQEAFNMNYQFVSNRLYPYLQSMHQYQSFAFQAWPQYQQQVKQAQGNPPL